MQVDVMELQGGLLGWQIEKLAKTLPGAHTVSVRMGPFFRLKLEACEGGPVSCVLELTQPGDYHNSLHNELSSSTQVARLCTVLADILDLSVQAAPASFCNACLHNLDDRGHPQNWGSQSGGMAGPDSSMQFMFLSA